MFRVGSVKRKSENVEIVPQTKNVLNKNLQRLSTKQVDFWKVFAIVKLDEISEKEFLEKYNKIQQLDKEKDIKFFQCIGDGEISPPTINSITNFRFETKVKKKIILKKR